jgi:hypothetical protein
LNGSVNAMIYIIHRDEVQYGEIWVGRLSPQWFTITMESVFPELLSHQTKDEWLPVATTIGHLSINRMTSITLVRAKVRRFHSDIGGI